MSLSDKDKKYFKIPKKSKLILSDKTLQEMFWTIEKFIYNNRTNLLSLLNESFIKNLLNHFCHSESNKSDVILKKMALKTLENIFFYKKKYIKYLYNVLYIDENNNEGF